MTLYSIPPHVPFLRELAGRIMDGTLLGGWNRSNPFWLSDVTVILPTRRAKLALADAFAAHSEARGFLPDIRTFGGEAEEEEPFLPPYDAPVQRPAASMLERRLALSDLVAAWAGSRAGSKAFSTPPTAGEILAMSESLGELIDDLITEERTAADIRAIAGDLGPDLGEYWQQTLGFLDIALRFWPDKLAERGHADPAALRGQRLDRQALAAPLLYGDRPVIAAGSTGSIPATARLLKAIHLLPRGAVVLPGLNCTMSPADHAALLDDTNNPHGHPQYGLTKLLRRLDAAVSDVVDLRPAENLRTTLVNRALALTKDTALWPAQRLMALEVGQATSGLSVIAARNEDEEARAVAVAARHALAERQTVAIVTPDRNLARRIAAELKRFDIWVDDAAGTPLFQSGAGRLLRQILALATGGCAAVDLISLLRNRAASFGWERAVTSAVTDDIELGLLRGQRPKPGLAGLRLLLAANVDKTTSYPARRLSAQQAEAIEQLFTRLEDALEPIFALLKQPLITAGALAHALCQALTRVADSTGLSGRNELNDWSNQLAELGEAGHRFPPRQLEDVLQSLMTGFQVRTREDRRHDITIFGQIEARLQNPDLMILAGLNEDVWPQIADPGPWLSRGMRLRAGLEPPERRQGQAAHDFAQGIGNEMVILAYSERLGTSPALPSRLLQRLEAFADSESVRGWHGRGELWLEQARRLDAVAETRAATRPLPNPPVAVRPRSLSVTEVETLMRSPYDLYAKHVLRLKPLDPLGDTPDRRERGTIIHDIFAQFVIDGHDVTSPHALETLMELARARFAGLEAIAERRDIWLRRFETAAIQFLTYEQARNDAIKQRHAEIGLGWDLQLAESFRITGRADRVDEMGDGTLEIIDFKTGSPPTKGAMQAFEVPQLLLEAQIARAGSLEGVAPADTSALTYIKVGLGPDAFIPKPFIPAEDHDIMSAADEIARRMQGHIEHFLLRPTPLPARLLPLPGQRFAGAYDHLSRVVEWTLGDGEEGES